MKKFDPRSLPYLGALVQAVLFALAGYRYFNLGLWGAGAGFGVGMLVNFSMAVASSKVSDVAKSRKPLSYLSLIGLFVLSPVIICSSLGFSVATLSWSLAADMSIMLTGAIMGNALVKKDETPQVASKETPKVASKARKAAKVAPQVARKAIPDTELLAYLQANPGESHQQVAEHFGVSRQAVGQRVKKLYEVKQ
jgi:Zn-dependent protease with chaperone function